MTANKRSEFDPFILLFVNALDEAGKFTAPFRKIIDLSFPYIC